MPTGMGYPGRHGALISTAQLMALAERFGQTITGQDLAGPREVNRD